MCMCVIFSYDSLGDFLTLVNTNSDFHKVAKNMVSFN